LTERLQFQSWIRDGLAKIVVRRRRRQRVPDAETRCCE